MASLTLLSQDPREYLPFLRDLRQLDTHRQRFKIDDHLERYDSALKNLALAGAESFDEALEYTKAHGLFTTALQAFKDDPVKYKVSDLSGPEEETADSRTRRSSSLRTPSTSSSNGNTAKLESVSNPDRCPPVLLLTTGRDSVLARRPACQGDAGISEGERLAGILYARAFGEQAHGVGDQGARGRCGRCVRSSRSADGPS